MATGLAAAPVPLVNGLKGDGFSRVLGPIDSGYTALVGTSTGHGELARTCSDDCFSHPLHR